MGYYKSFYINEKNLPKKLSQKEFDEYFEAFQLGNLEAREKLILGNLRLVIKITSTKYADYNQDEVFQVGVIGLIKAVDNFDASFNCAFSTYACPMIIGEIRRYLRDYTPIKVSRGIKELLHSIFKYKNEYLKSHGVEPTNQEIAKHLDVEENEINVALMSAIAPMSMWEPIYNKNGEEIYLLDRLADEKAEFEEIVINNQYNSKILPAMKKILTERECIIIMYLFGLNGDCLTQEKVASLIGVSQAQISRIKDQALKKLQNQLKDKINEEKDERNKNMHFDVHTIHPDLTFPIFRNLIFLFPKREREIYMKKLKGIPIFNENEKEQVNRIEKTIKEIFLQYLELKKNRKLSEDKIREKLKTYYKRHFLSLRYRKYTFEEIKKAIKKLSPHMQNILHQRYGEDLISYNKFTEDKNKNFALLSLAHKKLEEELERSQHPKSLISLYSNYSFEELSEAIKRLPESYQNVIYLRHGKSLIEYNKFPNDKNYNDYYALYVRAKKAMEMKLTNEQEEERKTVLNSYKREDLLYVLPLLPVVIQKSIYLRHGKLLNKTTSWFQIKLPEEKPISTYMQNYYRSYKFIDRILAERIELQEKAKKNSIAKLGEYDVLEIKEALTKLDEKEREVVFIKHGMNLTEFNPWPTNRPMMYYKDLYEKAIFHLKEILKNKNSLPKEEKVMLPLAAKIEVKEKAKEKPKEPRKAQNLVKDVAREDLLWAISYLTEHQARIVYLRHGKNLDTTQKWPSAPVDRPANYYHYNYYAICKKIHSLLEKRKDEEKNKEPITSSCSEMQVIKPIVEEEEMMPVKAVGQQTDIAKTQEEPSKKKKKKKQKTEQEVLEPVIEKKRLDIQKNMLVQEKENNVKIELYNEFYTLYGNFINERELKSIIEKSVSSYNKEENIDIKYSSQFKIESAILLLLSNKYKENPNSEESLAILMQINCIFVSKMKARYPLMEESKIENAIESVFNTYEEEKSFSVEIMKKLRGINRKS